MKKLAITFTVLMILISGCGNEKQDSRVNLQEGVGSDTIGANIITNPVRHAFSALIGERVEVYDATLRKNDAGFMELYVTGYNNSYDTLRFQYRVEWLDDDGLPIESHSTTWHAKSVAGKSTFTIKDTATRTNAIDFRMNTRDKE